MKKFYEKNIILFDITFSSGGGNSILTGSNPRRTNDNFNVGFNMPRIRSGSDNFGNFAPVFADRNSQPITGRRTNNNFNLSFGNETITTNSSGPNFTLSFDNPLGTGSGNNTGSTFAISFENEAINGIFNRSSSPESNPELNEIAFRKELNENPLKRQAAENLLEVDGIDTERGSSSNIEDLLGTIKKDHSSYNYAAARQKIYTTDLSPLSDEEQKEAYYTALIDQYVTRDLIGGLVLAGDGNSFVEKLASESASDLNTFNSESTARERYIALRKSLQNKMGVAEGEDPASIAMKDIINNMEEVKVQERDDEGKVKKDSDDKPIKITIDESNFERYLDDPKLQEAIAKEINKRSYYQNNNYQKVIDDFRAKNPEYAPIKSSSPNEKAVLKEDSKTKLETLSQELRNYISQGGQDVVDYDATTDKYKLKDNSARNSRNGWKDYKDIQWNGEHGSIFSEENRNIIKELYNKHVDENGSVKSLDQFTALMLSMVDKGAKGELTNKEVEFLRKITIESDWKPEGGTSKELAKRIRNIIGTSGFWDED